MSFSKMCNSMNVMTQRNELIEKRAAAFLENILADSNYGGMYYINLYYCLIEGGSDIFLYMQTFYPDNEFLTFLKHFKRFCVDSSGYVTLSLNHCSTSQFQASFEVERKCAAFFEHALKGMPHYGVHFESLRGCVGQAPYDIQQYINCNLRGINLLHFFMKHHKGFNVTKSGLVSIRRNLYSFSDKRVHHAVSGNLGSSGVSHSNDNCIPHFESNFYDMLPRYNASTETEVINFCMDILRIEGKVHCNRLASLLKNHAMHCRTFFSYQDLFEFLKYRPQYFSIEENGYVTATDAPPCMNTSYSGITHLIKNNVENVPEQKNIGARQKTVDFLCNILKNNSAMHFMRLVELTYHHPDSDISSYFNSSGEPELQKFFQGERNFSMDREGYLCLKNKGEHSTNVPENYGDGSALSVHGCKKHIQVGKGTVSSEHKHPGFSELEVVQFFIDTLKQHGSLHYAKLIRTLERTPIQSRFYFAHKTSQKREFFLQYPEFFSLNSDVVFLTPQESCENFRMINSGGSEAPQLHNAYTEPNELIESIRSECDRNSIDSIAMRTEVRPVAACGKEKTDAAEDMSISMYSLGSGDSQNNSQPAEIIIQLPVDAHDKSINSPTTVCPADGHQEMNKAEVHEEIGVLDFFIGFLQHVPTLSYTELIHALQESSLDERNFFSGFDLPEKKRFFTDRPHLFLVSPNGDISLNGCFDEQYTQKSIELKECCVKLETLSPKCRKRKISELCPDSKVEQVSGSHKKCELEQKMFDFVHAESHVSDKHKVIKFFEGLLKEAAVKHYVSLINALEDSSQCDIKSFFTGLSAKEKCNFFQQNSDVFYVSHKGFVSLKVRENVDKRKPPCDTLFHDNCGKTLVCSFKREEGEGSSNAVVNEVLQIKKETATSEPTANENLSDREGIMMENLLERDEKVGLQEKALLSEGLAVKLEDNPLKLEENISEDNEINAGDLNDRIVINLLVSILHKYHVMHYKELFNLLQHHHPKVTHNCLVNEHQFLSFVKSLKKFEVNAKGLVIFQLEPISASTEEAPSKTDVKKHISKLNTIKFFVKILKNKSVVHFTRLIGLVQSSAPKDVKEYIQSKYHGRRLVLFFGDNDKIFEVTNTGSVQLKEKVVSLFKKTTMQNTSEGLDLMCKKLDERHMKKNVMSCTPDISLPANLDESAQSDCLSFFSKILDKNKGIRSFRLLQHSISEAPEHVKTYLMTKYPGENLRNFFKLNFSHFIISGGNIFLNDDRQALCSEIQCSSNSSASEMDVRDKLERRAVNFFTIILWMMNSRASCNMLSEQLVNSTVEVRNHILSCYQPNIKLFFLKHPKCFTVSDDGYVSLKTQY